MKLSLSVLFACLAGAMAAPAIDISMVEEINAANAGWTAEISPRFEGRQIEHVQRLCGAIVDPEVVVPLPVKADHEFVTATEDLPAEFDARTQWGSKCPSIMDVRDQADCGSCWAFGSTEAFNDRLCIASDGAFTKLLSPEDTVSCCGFLQCFSMGCNGGQPGMAWRWFTTHGVVTGGDYSDKNSGATCLPYELAPCAHHVTGTPLPDCPSKEDPTPACKSSCESGYKIPFAQDKHKADSSYSVSGVTNIMKELVENGPVTGAFTVYADFPAYKSGVYKHTTGSQLGGHAIKIIGYGTENGEDYWLVANSWNKYWGDHGFFKIARGTDECGIESQVSAGKVSWTKTQNTLRHSFPMY